jgi:Saxitoxin biosynthesis operon protein SxtJ
MALIKIDDNPSDRDLRQFAAIWFPLFWVLAGALLYWKTSNAAIASLIVAAGVLIGAVGAWRIAFIRPVYLIWMYAAYPVGWTVSHILLASIFYLVVTPIGLVMRLFGYDPLQRRIDRSASTYWEPLEQIRQKSDYFRQA